MSGLSFLLFIMFDHKVDEYGRILRLWDFPRTIWVSRWWQENTFDFCKPTKKFHKAKLQCVACEVACLCLYNYTRVRVFIIAGHRHKNSMSHHLPRIVSSNAYIYQLSKISWIVWRSSDHWQHSTIDGTHLVQIKCCIISFYCTNTSKMWHRIDWDENYLIWDICRFNLPLTVLLLLIHNSSINAPE